MPVTLRHFIFLGIVAFAVTLACVPLAKNIAVRLGAIDYPNARRVNTRPIPRMGGIAMCAGIAAALLVELVGEYAFGWAGFYVEQIRSDVNHAACMGGLLVVALVGAVDDVVHLSPLWKLFGQITAALIMASSGVLLEAIVNPIEGGLIHFGWLAYPLTVLYLVAFMNVINLVDGLDGLAAGIAAIAAFWLFLIAFDKGLVETAMLSVVLLGASTGFLRHNRAPASIFMGDSGSLMLGGMLGVISLLGVMRSPTVVVLIVPLVIAAIPILDTAAAIVRRVKNRKPILQPDKGHLHHALMGRGFSTQKSVAILHAWTFIFGFGAFLISSAFSGAATLVVFAVLIVASLGILWWTGILGPVLRHHYHGRGKGPVEDDAVAHDKHR